MCANLAVNESPARASTAADKAPERITSPASSGISNSDSLLANHATQLAGFPKAAAPTPVLTSSPFFEKAIPISSRSMSFTFVGLPPRT
jgi:hypothetical protein